METIEAQTVWHNDSWNGEPVILAGDIGGTNTNLALVSVFGGHFEIMLEMVFPSKSIQSIVPAIRALLDAARERFPEIEPEGAGISGAGPISHNYCSLSNLDWDVDGAEIEREFGFTTTIINDFEAISYGVPLLDLDDASQVTHVPHTDGHDPEPIGNMSLIIGAGTGLGVGMLVREGERYRAMPSEGGHACFAAFDLETEELRSFVQSGSSTIVEIEDLLSGRGLAKILDFFVQVRGVRPDDTLSLILGHETEKRPALISKHAETHPVCRDVIRLFVKIYGRVAADFSATVLPRHGLFLAGGIVSKNERYFLDGSQFIYFFEQNSRPQVKEILRKIPVYIVKNYSISLVGAAHAAWLLQD
ncbi:glucokinase [Pelagicoccus sp. SDUM812003]|uniref:glucokinase n=1 Tax=Pelagicoccus sp. SDUM812003 TaxID=3041267 RepID=UPI00280D323C|nr:glucokinase [Pelagicoccus sp. SDUM812003]MDQ8205143.1 glucokinase [Pelagicoccus sp. SDUM812003]